jgi:hypothetical protein
MKRGLVLSEVPSGGVLIGKRLTNYEAAMKNEMCFHFGDGVAWK